MKDKNEMERKDGTQQAELICGLLIGVPDVAALLGIGERTVWKHDSAGRLPQPVRLGRRVLWRREELDDWIRAGCPPRDQWKWSIKND